MLVPRSRAFFTVCWSGQPARAGRPRFRAVPHLALRSALRSSEPQMRHLNMHRAEPPVVQPAGGRAPRAESR